MRSKILLCILLVTIVAGCRKDPTGIPTDNPKGGTAGSEPLAVSAMLQNNMVIQRNKPLQISGTTNAGLKVMATVSWSSSSYSATAGANGQWTITVPVAEAQNTPQTITAQTPHSNPVVISNVLIGDVWLCVGQSNMAMPMDSIAPFKGVTDFRNEIGAANYLLIRTCNIAANYQDAPLQTLSTPARWDAVTPATAAKLSAVAYFFARKLQASVKIPIGIITSSINGSNCEEWTDMATVKQDAILSAYYLIPKTSRLYNGMIHPLTNFAVKGFLWYQGENNQHNLPVSNYTRLNKAMIGGWRSAFKDPTLPFYFVQLTPFAEDYYATVPNGGNTESNYLSFFREAQAGVLETPGTGMAVTMDVGEADDHHPKNKKPVGERLALLALKNTYAQTLETTGPQYSSYEQSGSVLKIHYVPGTAAGLSTTGNTPLKQYFTVAGTDRIFRKATATISGSDIVLTIPADLPQPVQSVRYAFTNAPISNLQNSAGLPAAPFRTDSWFN